MHYIKNTGILVHTYNGKTLNDEVFSIGGDDVSNQD